MKIVISDSSKEKYGIYGNCVLPKGIPNIMEKSQESLDDRFGLEDTESQVGYNGNGAVFPFRDEN